MGTQHTPGPWKVDPTFLSEIQTADNQSIASAWHEHAVGKTINLIGILECPLEESAANARLIAAAPDLLSVIQSFVSHYPVGLNPFLDSAYNAGRAVIAKATEA